MRFLVSVIYTRLSECSARCYMCKQAMKKHSETQVTDVQPFHQQQQTQEKPEKEQLQYIC